MDPLLLKQLGEDRLQDLRHRADLVRALPHEPQPSARPRSLVSAFRRVTGSAIVTLGTRVMGEQRV